MPTFRFSSYCIIPVYSKLNRLYLPLTIRLHNYNVNVLIYQEYSYLFENNCAPSCSVKITPHPLKRQA